MDTSKNLNISYKYNREGIRTSKVINGVETKYYLEGNSIIYEQRGDTLIYYLYDLTGLIGIKYNGNIYYYTKNLQGDIIGLLNVNNEQIVSYEYDSWGSLISIKDQNGNIITDENNIGIINPFRYREYYYDSETGMYYLNSRYYNPTWSRFINADGIIGANQDILGYNLYAYVSNNPVMFSDQSGFGLYYYSLLQIDIMEQDKRKNNADGTCPYYGPAVQKENKNMVDFILEVGNGTGIGGNIGNLGASSYKNTTDRVINNNYYVYSTENSKISLALISYNVEKELLIKPDNTAGWQKKTYFAFTIFLVSITPDTVFIGLDVDLHFYVGGHIKIGWEFKL